MKSPPTGLLSDGSYVRLWLIGWTTGVVRWLELLAYGLAALAMTGSPILVALVALVRFLPLALFSLPFGAAGDQLSPRRMMVVALAVMCVSTTGFWLAEAAGLLSYAMLVVASALSGLFWASDLPLRRKLIGEIAGPKRLAQAMSLDYATSNGTRMLGPLIGGILYQSIGIGGIFGLSVLLYAVSLALMLGVRASGPKRGGRFRVGVAWFGAVRATGRVLRDNDARAILAGTVVFNVWGFPFVSMIPVIGQDSLNLSPASIGYVTAIEGMTGLVGIILVALWARPAFYRRIYVAGAALHLVAVAWIGLVSGLVPLAIGLGVAGIATAGFASMQATLIYSVAPKGMRGRYLGLISICIGGGLIGFANVGVMAEMWGAETALIVMAAEGVVALTFISLGWRALRRECGLPAGEQPRG